MDCNYWSCFAQEDERLFIGGGQALEMRTIRYIPDQEDYHQYVKVINILDNMIDGVALLGIKPLLVDLVCMERLIGAEVGGVIDINTPKYVQTLFHHFLIKQTQIMFITWVWEEQVLYHEEDRGMTVYGFSKFRKIFMEKKEINFLLFIKLLPNLQTFIVGCLGVGQAGPSIPLSSEFTSNILECISYLNASSLSFDSFKIIKPSSSINEYIEQNKHKFESKGWVIKSDTFVDQEGYDIKGEEMLVIQKN